MKKISHTLFVAVTLATGAAVAGEAPRQLYAPIDRIYTVEEAQNLSLYKRLVKEGVSMAELNQPDAFVKTYSDIGPLGGHHYSRVAFIPQHLRGDIQIDTIVSVNRYDESALVNEVVPRTMQDAYECVKHMGIAGCVKDVVDKSRAVSK